MKNKSKIFMKGNKIDFQTDNMLHAKRMYVLVLTVLGILMISILVYGDVIKNPFTPPNIINQVGDTNATIVVPNEEVQFKISYDNVSANDNIKVLDIFPYYDVVNHTEGWKFIRTDSIKVICENNTIELNESYYNFIENPGICNLWFYDFSKFGNCTKNVSWNISIPNNSSIFQCSLEIIYIASPWNAIPSSGCPVPKEYAGTCNLCNATNFTFTQSFQNNTAEIYKNGNFVGNSTAQTWFALYALDVNKNVTQLNNTLAEITITVGGKGVVNASCHTPSDVVLVSDLSGSMVWSFNGFGECEQPCSISKISSECHECMNSKYCNETSPYYNYSKIQVVKHGMRTFRDIILSHGDSAGLVGYDDNIYLNPSNITQNNTELTQEINNYSSHFCRNVYYDPNYGWLYDHPPTTNSCGALNKSIEMLENSTNENKAIIFMSDGAPNIRCPELYTEERLREVYGDQALNTLMQAKDYCEGYLNHYFVVVPYNESYDPSNYDDFDSSNPETWPPSHVYCSGDDFDFGAGDFYGCDSMLGVCAFCTVSDECAARFDAIEYGRIAKQKNITVVTIGVDIPSMDIVESEKPAYAENVLKDISAGDYYAMRKNYSIDQNVKSCEENDVTADEGPQICDIYQPPGVKFHYANPSNSSQAVQSVLEAYRDATYQALHIDASGVNITINDILSKNVTRSSNLSYSPLWFKELFNNSCPADHDYTFCNTTADGRESLTWFLKKLYFNENFTIKFNVSISACVNLTILEDQIYYDNPYTLCHPNGTCYPGQNMTIKVNVTNCADIDEKIRLNLTIYNQTLHQVYQNYTVNVSLSAGNSTIVTYIYSINSSNPQNYTINASVIVPVYGKANDKLSITYSGLVAGRAVVDGEYNTTLAMYTGSYGTSNSTTIVTLPEPQIKIEKFVCNISSNCNILSNNWTKNITAHPNDEILYKIKVSNVNGTGWITNITVLDKIPEKWVFLEITDPGSCNAIYNSFNNQIINFSIKDLNTNESCEFTYKVKVYEFENDGIYNNTANVSGILNETAEKKKANCSNGICEDNATVEILANVSMRVEKIITVNMPLFIFEPGMYISFNITITNDGYNTLYNITLIEILPIGVEFINATIINGTSQGLITQQTGNYSTGQNVTITGIGNLSRNESITINITAYIHTGANETSINTVNVTAKAPNGTEISKFANATFYIVYPNIIITKTLTSGQYYEPGYYVNYTIR
ncbi:MAG: hypothetical protein ACK4YO_01075, partial [Candidatus Altarchaeaceae archaeon]